MRALSERAPQAALLFITGSPALSLLEGLPANADYVKIPTIAKTGSKGFQPPHLPIALKEVSLLRERLIREALRTFAPDVLLVDNFPLGSHGELLPALQEARRLSTRAILGLRDIVDAPEVVRAEWERQGVYDVLDRYYDRILVYGMREVFDLEEAYALPAAVASKVHYCGYVTATAPPPRPPAEVRAALGIKGPFLLATGGGGGDGFPLLKALIQALPLIPDMQAVLFTGPLMSPSHRSKLRAQAEGRPGVMILEYSPDLRSYMAAADLVVSMCGYNIAAEITALRARALVVPRTWRYGEHLNRTTAGSEWEQMGRAQALARMGLVSMLEPEALTPERLAEKINDALARPSTGAARSGSMPAINLRGVEEVTRHILALASEREGTSGKR
jgi:predicted glycosyltransferase